MFTSIRRALFAFSIGVATIYVVAAWMTARYVHRRWIRKGPPFPRWWLWAFRVVLAVAVLGVLCGAYGHFIEPYWVEVTRVRIPTPKLPPGSRPIRIVHLSDLHSDPTPRLEERLPDLVEAQHPDLIVFTGDAANSVGGVPVFQRCLRRIAAIAPTFAVTGNWDLPDVLDGTGARVLRGEAARVVVEGRELWVAGTPYGGACRLPRLFAATPSGALVVFLYHLPDLIEAVADRGVDVCLSGHTHGGQIALPFYGAVITLSRYGKRFERGLYRVEETWLYVNRGIGMEGGGAPRVRFLSRPEVAVIELVPE